MVRELNDQLRKSGDPSLGKIVITHGISNLPRDYQMTIINAVRTYNDFNKDVDDPWSEHDFGKVTVRGRDVFWKIDYYDPKYERGVEDEVRNNKLLCKRVLTIMFASEY